MMVACQRPTIYGDDQMLRYFKHVENINLGLAERPKAGNRVFSVALGESHTPNELVEILNELLDTRLQPIYGDARPGDVPAGDVGGVKEVDGYDPTAHRVAGLQRKIDSVAGSQSTGDPRGCGGFS
jgi:nucleoside-diphosphate-sugar epimerase